MEYCAGGDLSNVIKQALKHNRPIPEDTIWNYFMQILLALQHCHHPNGNGHTRSNSIGSDTYDPQKRPQILHRDLKPDNGALSNDLHIPTLNGYSFLGRRKPRQTRRLWPFEGITTIQLC